MGLERRGCVVQPRSQVNWKQEEPASEAKPFKIPKREVWEAFKRVRANQGAAGVDGQSIAEFEADLRNNLYMLWNRLSSGSYFPPPVRRVDIPKANGGTRPLGIPTVADRIAQEVARRYLEPILEPVFHGDSYGYRPGRSAIDAVRTARQRCWRYDWVLDLDVKSYFDSIDWELMLAAVRRHTDCPWVLLYVERWLKAPVQMGDGSIVPRTAGTPNGRGWQRSLRRRDLWRDLRCGRRTRRDTVRPRRGSAADEAPPSRFPRPANGPAIEAASAPDLWRP
jgi:retron-type reverse transcriptase